MSMNYKKEGQKLPIFGVGPYLIWGIGVFIFVGIILSQNVLSNGIVIGIFEWIFRIVGVVLIAVGAVVWYIGALKSDMDECITENKLKTDGIYSWVRNPMYSGWWFLLTGISFQWHNLWLLLLIPINWLIMTIVLMNTEEKWLLDVYGESYVQYKKHVNRLIPLKGGLQIYETKISDARWMAYDVPGNIGWIAYFVSIILIFLKKPDFISHSGLLAICLFAVLPAIMMLIGIVELIRERIRKLDRLLSQGELYRGFGMLFYGGVFGALIAAAGIIYGIVVTESSLTYLWIMLCGGILCAIFGGLLFKGYKKRSLFV